MKVKLLCNYFMSDKLKLVKSAQALHAGQQMKKKEVALTQFVNVCDIFRVTHL